MSTELNDYRMFFYCILCIVYFLYILYVIYTISLYYNINYYRSNI